MNYEFAFEITPDAIAAGKTHDCYCCPIALSARTYFGDRYSVRVTDGGMDLYRNPADDPMLTLRARTDARRFIRRFDAGEAVTPGSVHYTLVSH